MIILICTQVCTQVIISAGFGELAEHQTTGTVRRTHGTEYVVCTWYVDSLCCTLYSVHTVFRARATRYGVLERDNKTSVGAAVSD